MGVSYILWAKYKWGNMVSYMSDWSKQCHKGRKVTVPFFTSLDDSVTYDRLGKVV